MATAVLTALYRFTRFGLATRAAAGNEKGALLLGISPDRLGAVNWALASVLAGARRDPDRADHGARPDHHDPAGRPGAGRRAAGPAAARSCIAAAAGIGIGMLQSLILGYAVRPDVDLDPRLAAHHRAPAGRPGRADHRRARVGRRRAPGPLGDRWPAAARLARRRATSPRGRCVLGGRVGGLLTVSAPGTARRSSCRWCSPCSPCRSWWSPGFVGQISLAQLAFAGVVGLHRDPPRRARRPVRRRRAARRRARRPCSACSSGLPATRVRGMSLAITTLALAVAIEQLVLASPPFSGGPAGSSAPRPVPVRARPRRQRHGCGQLPAGVRRDRCWWCSRSAASAVANLRRNGTGLRWLAVRANERAAAAAGHRRGADQARRVRDLVVPRRAGRRADGRVRPRPCRRPRSW